MIRSACTVILFGSVGFLCAERVVRTQAQQFQIEGVYRFVSEVTQIDAPEASRAERKAPEYAGLIFFKEGYFSLANVQRSRDSDWFSKFPKNFQELGYESFAGKYEIERFILVLKPDIHLHPFSEGRERRFSVTKLDDKLILTEELKPYVESQSRGKRTIVLEKL